MTETLKLIVTKFTDEAITITSMVLLFVLAVLVVYWLYNRRKFRKLTHQIPASVVKNYLDSIIQNSSSLKSSLFRGSGLDIGEGIPSVMPLKDLPAGSISVGTGNESEELNQKIAELSALKGKLADKDRVIAELEKRIENLNENANEDLAEQITIYKQEVESLQEKLRLKEDEIVAARSAATNSDDAELESKVTALEQECENMKNRLAEYEIIEEDLANLKRLQQENARLKKELEELRGGAPVDSEPEVQSPDIEDFEQMIEATQDNNEVAEIEENIAEEVLAEAPETSEQQEEKKDTKGDQRSAEELLSEFEKMLG